VNSPISNLPPARPNLEWVLERKTPTPTTSIELDAKQEEVAQHRHGALLVLAGPGTGKTATLTETVIRIIKEGEVKAHEILVLTFARKAAEEIRDRIVSRVGGGQLPGVCTFHALALSIVREFPNKVDSDGYSELRLMSAPEQELVVRQLIDGSLEVSRLGKTVWPEFLKDAVKTRGMSIEIRNAIARARSLGLDSDQLSQVVGSNPEWSSLANFMNEYLDNLEMISSLDYNELIIDAFKKTQDTSIQEILRNRYKVIIVDEYQDTDPLQVKILQNMVSSDACLIAVGDPDQSIYGFRGADSSAVFNFFKDFAHINHFGTPKQVNLKVTRRFGSNLAEHAQRLIGENSSEEIPGFDSKSHRVLETLKSNPGDVFVTDYESREEEADMVAEKIRSIVDASDLKWKDIAILVRSGTIAIPVLERALTRASIPVDVSFDELPIAQEPAIKVLIEALKVVRNFDYLKQNPDVATFLLTSGIGGLSAADLRHIGRQLRDVSRGTPEQDWSENLIADALRSPHLTALIEPEVGGLSLTKLVALRENLNKAGEAHKNNESVAQVLWRIWSKSAWKDVLRAKALSGDQSSFQSEHDLDAVITFMQLARTHSMFPGKARDIDSFISEVENLLVPAQPSLRALEPNAVSLMSAHKSKGLEWEVVFICGADEESWPDLKRRNSIFEPEKLGFDNFVSHIERSEILREERRLFFVAFTRAKSQVYISTTSADKEEGKLPSRFISNLMAIDKSDEATSKKIKKVAPLQWGIEASYSPQGLVAQLRRVASSDDETFPKEIRDAAEQRLAYLANLQTAKGEKFVPSANPDSWWGITTRTFNEIPVDDPTKPVYVRGSSLQKISDCALTWFMHDRASAQESTSTAMNFGSIIHALAEAVAKNKLEPDLEIIEKEIDKIWGKVKFGTEWEAGAERISAINCVKRFLDWLGNNGRAIAGTELNFDDELTIVAKNGQSERFRLRGQIDIVQVSSEGGTYIADIKTSTTKPSLADGENHMQLALYQYAVNQGFVKDENQIVIGRNAATEGAVLICVRHDAGVNSSGPMLRTQKAIGVDQPWVEEKLVSAAEVVRSEKYLPTISEQCDWCSIKTSCPLQPEGKPVIQ
jgi:superfamily I DNA/RNA helicase/RecB family exonuclease